ncbi:hypothetical protein BDD43_1896 [Mucilaginibacter gracilis]|uniref:Lipocalin-like domain-containing protein n=1 Tax=Mucilaginibacter gracilis TaxID=423350 RepID=A0A495IYF6_9SPHI|nr:hypothetical protein BDD43_1896 [Mucilaginibacter gracilis]
MLVNSCKKDNSDTVAYFLTNGTWQLAAVQTQTFVGDTLKRTDTLNTNCGLNQLFKFNNNNSCTYSNYHCITQSSAGTWQLASNDLILQTTLAAQDTAKGVVVTKPASVFTNAQIINLGQYSFVLQTGDTSPYYTSKTRRVITRYAFVHCTTCSN